MKRIQIIYTIALLAGFCQETYSQSNLINGFPKSEIFISGNSTLITGIENNNNSLENRYGYGVGIDLIFRESKTIKVILGLEFDRTNQFRETERHGLGGYPPQDITWGFNSMTVPVTARLNAGKSGHFFIEAGALFHFVFHSYCMGTSHSGWLIDGKYVEYYDTFKFDSKESIVNPGFRGGFGYAIPVAGYEIFVKSDYVFWFGEIKPYMQPPIKNRFVRLIVGVRI